MDVTLQDLRGVLKGQYRADEIIFWFAHAWYAGRDSDLYRVLRETNFTPRRFHYAPGKGPWRDPAVLYGEKMLRDYYFRDRAPVEYVMQPIRFREVQENDVLTHGTYDQHFQKHPVFACIDTGWPCRVYKHYGNLGVSCAEDGHGANFHPLQWHDDGTVKGFLG
jgi:hypothetical protein